jgi:hypothetical protein
MIRENLYLKSGKINNNDQIWNTGFEIEVSESNFEAESPKSHRESFAFGKSVLFYRLKEKI